MVKKLISPCALYLCFILSVESNGQNLIQLPIKVEAPENTYALIVACERYYDLQFGSIIVDASHAIYDAERFRNRLIKNFHIPTENILFYTAFGGDYLYYFTNNTVDLAMSENADYIFYYSGKIIQKKNPIETLIVDGEHRLLKLDSIVNILTCSTTGSTSIFIDAIDTSRTRTSSMMDSGINTFRLKERKKKASLYFPKKPPQYNSKPRNGSNPKLVARDTTPPSIEIISPVLNPETNTLALSTVDKIVVIGKAFDDTGIDKITVAGEEAHLREDGTFI